MTRRPTDSRYFSALGLASSLYLLLNACNQPEPRVPVVISTGTTVAVYQDCTVSPIPTGFTDGSGQPVNGTMASCARGGVAPMPAAPGGAR